MIRTETPWGFAIRSVAEGSLAAKGGLERGTIVLAVDGKPLRELDVLDEVLRSKKPGEVVKLACARRKRPAKLLDRHPWEDVVVEIRLPERDGGAGKEEKQRRTPLDSREAAATLRRLPGDDMDFPRPISRCTHCPRRLPASGNDVTIAATARSAD
jgi:hypothetical protein